MTKGLRRYRDEHYPSKELRSYRPNIDLFFNFMHKRHRMWHRRFVKHLPRERWTKDKILSATKYTNIYRQLDRGSLWAIHMIIGPNKNKYEQCVRNKDEAGKAESFKNMLFQLILYRMCCRIETFEKAGLPGYRTFDPVTYKATLLRVAEQHAVMTNAYLTCQAPKGMTKIEALIIDMIDCISKLEQVHGEIVNASVASDVFLALRKIRGMGRFFAYEVYCDLCYSKMIPFTTNDFVNVGPGCNEGLRLLFPYVGASLKLTDKKIHDLFDKQDKYFSRLGIKFRYCNWLEPVKDRLSLRTIEHSLCEFSKYWLQRHSLGKRRLDYGRWSRHDGFSIDDTGMGALLDEGIYDNFEKINDAYAKAKPSSPWKAFLKRVGNCNQEDIIKFVLSIR